MILCFIPLEGVKKMHNLLVKDFYIIKKYLWIPLFYSFVVFVLSKNIGELAVVYSIGTVMIAHTLMMYATSYDDKNNSEVVLNSLPISRFKIVLYRYISVFLFTLLGLASMILAGFVLDSLNLLNISIELKIGSVIGSLIGISLISFSYLPTYFKFGYVKAKIFNFIVFIMVFVGPVFLKNILDYGGKNEGLDKLIIFLNSQNEFLLSLFFIGIIIGAGLVSFTISMVIYNKREF